MAFGKAVRAETLDLLKTVLGKLRIVTTPDHVPDQLLFEVSIVPTLRKVAIERREKYLVVRGEISRYAQVHTVGSASMKRVDP